MHCLRALPFGLTPKRLLTVANRHTEGEYPKVFGQERVHGFEPRTKVWKTRMLPLHHTRWSLASGSNRESPAYKAGAVTIVLARQKKGRKAPLIS